jgi:hypothetical protein
MSTDPYDLAALQETQQLTLQIDWHSTHFIEEQCAAMGMLDLTGPGGTRACFIAE